MGEQLTVSVVVPTLNEAENIAPLVDGLMRSRELFEVVFVDDGSIDGTPATVRQLAQRYPLRLIERDAPAGGLSSAVLAGAGAAMGDLLVVMDADLSHPPERIGDLIDPIALGRAEMVIGSRYVRGGATPGWSVWRRAISRTASLLAYPLTGIHDSMCGFFAIRRQSLLELTPAAHGFKIAFETLVHRPPDFRVLEVPIVFRDRVRGDSKMTFAVALTFALRWLASAGKVSHRKLAPSVWRRPAPIAIQPAIEG